MSLQKKIPLDSTLVRYYVSLSQPSVRGAFPPQLSTFFIPLHHAHGLRPRTIVPPSRQDAAPRRVNTHGPCVLPTPPLIPMPHVNISPFSILPTPIFWGYPWLSPRLCVFPPATYNPACSPALSAPPRVPASAHTRSTDAFSTPQRPPPHRLCVSGRMAVQVRVRTCVRLCS